MRPMHPILGVGAVIFDAGAVLLVRRGHSPLEGVWTLPGGTVELGETLREAVGREVHEETGLRVEVGPLVEVVDLFSRGSDGRVEHHHVVADFLCRPTGGVLAAATDAADAAWVPIDRLEAFGVPALAIQVIRKGRTLL